jgi:ribosomal protein L21E
MRVGDKVRCFDGSTGVIEKVNGDRYQVKINSRLKGRGVGLHKKKLLLWIAAEELEHSFMVIN